MNPNWLEAVSLTGKHIWLEPLDPVAHAAPMLEHFEAVATTYTGSGYRETHSVPEMAVQLEQSRSRAGSVHWAVRLPDSGAVAGRVLYMDVQPKQRSLEIGTMLMPKFWGSPANLESKLLLLTRAFEVLEALRVQFVVDTENLRSQGSMEKLGAVREGVKRQGFVRADGSVRDQAIYSIVSGEWQGIKQKLESRLYGSMACSAASALSA
jgi:RimJ/RimL family protein N-acetyltransferase